MTEPCCDRPDLHDSTLWCAMRNAVEVDPREFGFQPLTRWSKPRLGEVVDIERPWGSFAFWHVCVEEEPVYIEKPPEVSLLCDQFLQFRVTDGIFAESLAGRAVYIRRVA